MQTDEHYIMRIGAADAKEVLIRANLCVYKGINRNVSIVVLNPTRRSKSTGGGETSGPINASGDPSGRRGEKASGGGT